MEVAPISLYFQIDFSIEYIRKSHIKKKTRGGPDQILIIATCTCTSAIIAIFKDIFYSILYMIDFLD